MTFRTMKRKDRDLGEDVAWEMLSAAPYGMLAVDGAEGYPYCVPMNHICRDGRILMHCSSNPRLLLESIGDGCRACFTVVEPLEGPRSRSAIAFGTVRLEPEMLPTTLEGLIDRFVPEQGREGARAGIPFASERATCLVMDIEHLTAKVVDKPEGR